MLNKDKREQFEAIFHLLFILFCEACENHSELRVAHVTEEVMDLAEWFGADEGEILAINHNAHCYVMNQSKIDVDKYNEEYKLGQLLNDIDI